MEFVAHADDPVRQPRGTDHNRVVLGPSMAGWRDDVVLGFRSRIAAFGDRRGFPESRPDLTCWPGEL
jgi:hypothetical protein